LDAAWRAVSVARASPPPVVSWALALGAAQKSAAAAIHTRIFITIPAFFELFAPRTIAPQSGHAGTAAPTPALPSDGG
jgi:hypothetical protein